MFISDNDAQQLGHFLIRKFIATPISSLFEQASLQTLAEYP
jgi:hypothetical protein